MKAIRSVALLTTVVLVGIGSGACRKRQAASATPSSSTESSPTPSESSPASTPPPANAVPALSAKDETEIRKRYMPAQSPWAKKTASEKQVAYFGWCQLYMLGDAATKAKVLAEIKQAGLSPEDTEALKKQNRDMRIPMLPL